MMKSSRIALAALAAFWMSGSAFAASTEAEIKAALVGNTFQGGMGGSVYTSYFGEDGVYKDKDGSGKYVISAEGVCYPETDFGCYEATIKGDDLEWFKAGKSEGAGKIVKGNPMKF